ncbi:hypothetical protein [Erysipelothrix aquatica]|uniref:hypothetical protein n=1 Tax=Erysipelothrix aquatica TaxID=2683714 RepID=UPI00135A7FFA|nr:hypothetical protein [Erysipelothrix aquatica]
MSKKHKAALFVIVSSLLIGVAVYLQGWYLSKDRLLSDFCESAGVANCNIEGPVPVYENERLYIFESDTHYIPMIVESWGPFSRFSIQNDHNLVKSYANNAGNLDLRWTPKQTPTEDMTRVKAYHGREWVVRNYEVLVMYRPENIQFGFGYDNRNGSGGKQPTTNALFEKTNPMNTVGNYAYEIMPLIDKMYDRKYRIAAYDEDQDVQKYYYPFPFQRSGTLKKATDSSYDVSINFYDDSSLYLQTGPLIKNTSDFEVQVAQSFFDTPVETYPLLLELELMGVTIESMNLDQMRIRYYQYTDDTVIVEYSSDAAGYQEWFVAPQHVYEQMQSSIFVPRL